VVDQFAKAEHTTRDPMFGFRHADEKNMGTIARILLPIMGAILPATPSARHPVVGSNPITAAPVIHQKNGATPTPMNRPLARRDQ